MNWIFIQALLLAGTAVILIVAALGDIRERRIPNRLCISICGLFALFALCSLMAGHSVWASVLAPLLTALLVLTVLGVLFTLKMMGGGDVKLLASMSLLAGPDLALPFLLYATIAGGLVALATLTASKLKLANSRETLTVPYGVGISTAGLWVCSVRFMALVSGP